jgi:hypothetical protein
MIPALSDLRCQNLATRPGPRPVCVQLKRYLLRVPGLVTRMVGLKAAREAKRSTRGPETELSARELLDQRAARAQQRV